MCERIDFGAEVERFRNRRLEGAYPYLWLDATFHKVREAGRVISVATGCFLKRFWTSVLEASASRFWAASWKKIPERFIGADPEYWLRTLCDRWAGNPAALDGVGHLVDLDQVERVYGRESAVPLRNAFQSDHNASSSRRPMRRISSTCRASPPATIGVSAILWRSS